MGPDGCQSGWMLKPCYVRCSFFLDIWNVPRAQVPKRIEFVDAVPRNAMGKVNKKALLKDYFS
jgi:non-ribosomal peptide synthetase component E (peptide arylation enzyme)